MVALHKQIMHWQLATILNPGQCGSSDFRTDPYHGDRQEQFSVPRGEQVSWEICRF
jgi:hypothetical protein